MISRAGYWAAIAIAAAWFVALVVLAVVGPGSGGAPWGPGQSRPFNLSASFPTGNTSYNGQLDCGPNITETVTFPAPGIMNYNLTQNQSGASVNIWMVYSNGYNFQNTGGPGQGRGTTEYVDGTFHFGFIACGPSPTVSLGFWGTVAYWAAER